MQCLLSLDATNRKQAVVYPSVSVWGGIKKIMTHCEHIPLYWFNTWVDYKIKQIIYKYISYMCIFVCGCASVFMWWFFPDLIGWLSADSDPFLMDGSWPGGWRVGLCSGWGKIVSQIWKFWLKKIRSNSWSNPPINAIYPVASVLRYVLVSSVQTNICSMNMQPTGLNL